MGNAWPREFHGCWSSGTTGPLRLTLQDPKNRLGSQERARKQQRDRNGDAEPMGTVDVSFKFTRASGRVSRRLPLLWVPFIIMGIPSKLFFGPCISAAFQWPMTNLTGMQTGNAPGPGGQHARLAAGPGAQHRGGAAAVAGAPEDGGVPARLARSRQVRAPCSKWRYLLPYFSS
jgi:hypothetical protein